MKTILQIEKILREKGLLREIAGGQLSEQGKKDHERMWREKEVKWITSDSRRVSEGTLFICKGAAFREEYLREAASGGSIAYLGERPVATRQKLPGLIVTDVRKAMAEVSSWFFEYHPDDVCLTGITGTKGKTTTAWYLKAMLDLWEQDRGGKETGLISTIENYDGKRRTESEMTTPESPALYEMLQHAGQSGLHYVTMEVSSQALKYHRVRGLSFHTAVFLNISEDHISPQEHCDFEDYFRSKLTVFRQAGTACVNLDSDYGDRILEAAGDAGRIVTFGRSPRADLRCSEIRTGQNQITFRVTCDRFSEVFSLAMRGKFNVENAMAAIAAAYVYRVPVKYMKQALAETKVPGRMENFVSRDGKICCIVDFAHNRLSFEKLFDAVLQEYTCYRRIITVFGCPGGKALNRRRELGSIAGLFSDTVIVTSDDPGMECPGEIAAEVQGYVEKTGCPCLCVEERMKAVEKAMGLARKNREKTLILVLGRGNEKMQRIGRDRFDYPTDASIVRWAIESYDAAHKFLAVMGMPEQRKAPAV